VLELHALEASLLVVVLTESVFNCCRLVLGMRIPTGCNKRAFWFFVAVLGVIWDCIGPVGSSISLFARDSRGSNMHPASIRPAILCGMGVF